MNYNDFEEAVTQLHEYKIKRDEYFDKIPSDISECIFDNTYQSSTEYMLEAVMKVLFKDFYQDVIWFLFECTDTIKSNKDDGDEPNIVCSNGKEYWVHDLASYLEYAKIELFDNEMKDTV